jgi:hypothetical protein
MNRLLSWHHWLAFLRAGNTGILISCMVESWLGGCTNAHHDSCIFIDAVETNNPLFPTMRGLWSAPIDPASTEWCITAGCTGDFEKRSDSRYKSRVVPRDRKYQTAPGIQKRYPKNKCIQRPIAQGKQATHSLHCINGIEQSLEFLKVKAS